MMVTNLILTVGNAMMGDDGAGPYLAERLQAAPIAGWQLVDGGTAPENALHTIRALQPERVLLVDAAEIGETAGTLRIISPQEIAELFIFSTHNMPLNFLIDELKTFVPEVMFVGIQPAIVAFSFPMTQMVKEAVERLYKQIETWDGTTPLLHDVACNRALSVN